MVILPSRTSQICCLDCAFLCILTHSDVDNTEPQKGILHASCKKGQSFFLTALMLLVGNTNNIGTSGLLRMVGSMLLTIDMVASATAIA
jgi:hypothetical protein